MQQQNTLPHLPPAFKYKVIFMERDLNEVLASQRKMLNRMGKTTQDESYPLELMKTFEKNLKLVKNWAESKSNVEILFVEHQTAIQAPFEVALQVQAFLGLDIAVEKMVQVVDPSLHRERS
jgi:Sulfotransferase domain